MEYLERVMGSLNVLRLKQEPYGGVKYEINDSRMGRGVGD